MGAAWPFASTTLDMAVSNRYMVCSWLLPYVPGVPGDHQIFVGWHDSDRHPATITGDDGRAVSVTVGIELDAEDREVAADSRPDVRRVLADPSSEDEGSEPTECAYQRTQELPGLGAVEVNDQGCPVVIHCRG